MTLDSRAAFDNYNNTVTWKEENCSSISACRGVCMCVCACMCVCMCICVHVCVNYKCSNRLAWVLACVCVCTHVCPAPFLSAGWLGVTLSLSTSLPAPLDPVAISNRLRELASPLLQPIAFTSLCNCVHECEWAGVPYSCVCVCIHVCARMLDVALW